MPYPFFACIAGENLSCCIRSAKQKTSYAGTGSAAVHPLRARQDLPLQYVSGTKVLTATAGAGFRCEKQHGRFVRSQIRFFKLTAAKKRTLFTARFHLRPGLLNS